MGICAQYSYIGAVVPQKQYRVVVHFTLAGESYPQAVGEIP